MVFGVITILLGGYVAAMNWYAPIHSKRENRNVSMIPLIGSALIGAGIYSITGSILWSLWAIPLDLGTLLFVFGIPWLFREIWESSTFNERAKFHANDNGREILISLCKNGQAAIHQEYNGTVGPQEYGSIPCSRGFNAEWNLNDDGVFHLTNVTGGRDLKLIPDGENFVSVETNVDTGAKPHALMDDLNFTQTKNRIAGQQYVAHGAAGRAGFGNNDFRRGPVNVDVIPLKDT